MENRYVAAWCAVLTFAMVPVLIIGGYTVPALAALSARLDALERRIDTESAELAELRSAVRHARREAGQR